MRRPGIVEWIEHYRDRLGKGQSCQGLAQIACRIEDAIGGCGFRGTHDRDAINLAVRFAP
jgi:hypothetical protein